MKLSIFLTCAALLIGSLVHAADSDADTRARKAALDVAGAFTNDGFKMRDGHWTGTLKPHEPVLLAVNLYAGNQYWFAAGSDDAAKNLEVKLFDEAGKFLPTEPYNAESRAAAGFSPTISGQYFVSLEIVEGEAAACCLLYSYK